MYDNDQIHLALTQEELTLLQAIMSSAVDNFSDADTRYDVLDSLVSKVNKLSFHLA